MFLITVDCSPTTAWSGWLQLSLKPRFSLLYITLSLQSSDVWLYPKPRVSDTTTCVWLDGKDTRVWLYTLPIFNTRDTHVIGQAKPPIIRLTAPCAGMAPELSADASRLAKTGPPSCSSCSAQPQVQLTVTYKYNFYVHQRQLVSNTVSSIQPTSAQASAVFGKIVF